MLTFLPLEQIAELEQQMRGGSYKPNTAQELLAQEVLTFVHGKQGLQAALQATQVGWHPTEVCISAAAHTLQALASPCDKLCWCNHAFCFENPLTVQAACGLAALARPAVKSAGCSCRGSTALPGGAGTGKSDCGTEAGAAGALCRRHRERHLCCRLC